FHRGVDARSQPGSGLGLAIVAKIVDDHGGSVFVDEARPGPGAVVGFRLPS
ncbi:MAG: ATP-binding protein, partial [Actinomycetota bacterium]